MSHGACRGMTSPAPGDKRIAMAFLRRQIGHHPRFAALILAAALMLRLLVPAGFMPDVSSGRIAISICTGYGPAPMTPMTMPGHAMAMAGQAMADHDSHGSGSDKHRKADMPCGFGGLSAPGLAGADPIQLAVALAFVFATVPFAKAILGTRRPVRLRPPLRGPPAFL